MQKERGKKIQDIWMPFFFFKNLDAKHSTRKLTNKSIENHEKNKRKPNRLTRINPSQLKPIDT